MVLRPLHALAHLAVLSLGVIALNSDPKDGPHPNQRRAWVTLSYPMAGIGKSDMDILIHEAYALASSVRRHSQHPLVLITDLSMFNETADDFKSGMEAMGVRLHNMEHLKMPDKFLRDDKVNWAGAWNKLQIFNMTGWDRLVWLDADGMLTRSMDHLFDKPGTWSQGDDYFCHGVSIGVCSGLLSLKPDHEVFEGIIALSESLDHIHAGDQQLIQKYFEQIGEPVQILPFRQAAFGQCVDQLGYVPGFLHKPEGYTDCLRSLLLFGQNHKYAEHALKRCTSTATGFEYRKTLCAAHIPHDHGFNRFCESTV